MEVGRQQAAGNRQHWAVGARTRSWGFKPQMHAGSKESKLEMTLVFGLSKPVPSDTLLPVTHTSSFFPNRTSWAPSIQIIQATISPKTHSHPTLWRDTSFCKVLPLRDPQNSTTIVGPSVQTPEPVMDKEAGQAIQFL